MSIKKVKSTECEIDQMPLKVKWPARCGVLQ